MRLTEKLYKISLLFRKTCKITKNLLAHDHTLVGKNKDSHPFNEENRLKSEVSKMLPLERVYTNAGRRSGNLDPFNLILQKVGKCNDYF